MVIENKETITQVMSGFVLWLFVAVLIVAGFKSAMYYSATAKASDLLSRATEAFEEDPNSLEQYISDTKERYEDIKKNNFFVKPEPPKHPVKEVTAIMGKEAFINGKWYKVGDKVSDANVIEITCTKVVIEWQGKKKDFAPIKALSESKEDEKPQATRQPKQEKEQVKIAKAQKAETETVVAQNTEEDEFAWLGIELSPKARAKLKKYWDSMSDEQKQQAKEQWANASDEEKQQMIDRLESDD